MAETSHFTRPLGRWLSQPSPHGKVVTLCCDRGHEWESAATEETGRLWPDVEECPECGEIYRTTSQQR